MKLNMFNWSKLKIIFNSIHNNDLKNNKYFHIKLKFIMLQGQEYFKDFILLLILKLKK